MISTLGHGQVMIISNMEQSVEGGLRLGGRLGGETSDWEAGLRLGGRPQTGRQDSDWEAGLRLGGRLGGDTSAWEARPQTGRQAGW